MSETPELDRLAALMDREITLSDGSVIKLAIGHVSWGPAAPGMTPEQRAKVIADVVQKISAGDFEDITDAPD